MVRKKPVQPAISVVIPAYNEEKLLPQCLDSLRKQDFDRPFEVIVVDGGSKDRTVNIARRFGARVIRQKGKGIGDARFLGCRKARGEIIANTDADAILPRDWLSQIYAFFERNPQIGAVAGGFRWTADAHWLLRFFSRFNSLGDRVIGFLAGHYFFSGRNFAIRRTIYEKSGGFDPQLRYLEDCELASRVSKISRIGYLSDLKVTTVDRRWRGRVLKNLLTRLIPAFWFNVVIKKPHRRFNRWERVD